MDIRQKILETAYQTFYRQGFHACGVELLAAQANTTKRTLYAHFGSKEGLIEAVLQYRHEQFIQNMVDALVRYEEQQTAYAYLDFISNWTQSADFYGCMFINACAEYSDKASIPHQKSSRHKSEIRQILRQRLQNCGVPDANKKADMLFMIGEGLIVAAQSGQDLVCSIEEMANLLDGHRSDS
ncbi:MULTISPECIES: TetR/AcrR family transcriptional regulator [unclassified Neisseria]|uniref:TetR/AcrR family transcriptional regulator n=1 Tax=unclassified Neisseria TaxID=2623750 RepID=UPI0026654713|nr:MULTISPECIES: TetR/AcrR family transcriptional regulator [unclassified Neisseria]MDO1508846.1 TetR/AcrR family transcriptional regulator [Neisseria sp. MVDL19-042950]MDO1515105.1 TetR/AcrR family transcriptional regulator [Neisseria sp. MVDL18-041461]MDO1562465.1 TetR/AcrR family transcriptional regulator [Neisseria sp. MVDL20-010259]